MDKDSDRLQIVIQIRATMRSGSKMFEYGTRLASGLDFGMTSPPRTAPVVEPEVFRAVRLVAEDRPGVVPFRWLWCVGT